MVLIPIYLGLAISYHNSLAAGAPDEGKRLAAMVVFLIASLSDALDGYVARKFDQKSKLGAILDPAADKFLLVGALYCLTIWDWGWAIPQWLPLLVLCRDFFSTLGAIFLHRAVGDRMVVNAHWSGKLSTICQMILVSWIMLKWWLWWEPLPLVIVTGIFTFWSGMFYIYDALRQVALSKQTHVTDQIT